MKEVLLTALDGVDQMVPPQPLTQGVVGWCTKEDCQSDQRIGWREVQRVAVQAVVQLTFVCHVAVPFTLLIPENWGFSPHFLVCFSNE
jgi:hypothetical protein